MTAAKLARELGRPLGFVESVAEADTPEMPVPRAGEIPSLARIGSSWIALLGHERQGVH